MQTSTISIFPLLDISTWDMKLFSLILKYIFSAFLYLKANSIYVRYSRSVKIGLDIHCTIVARNVGEVTYTVDLTMRCYFGYKSQDFDC